MIKPNRPKALQSYLLSANIWTRRVWFLKVEQWDWPAVVFNEWDGGYPDLIQDYEKGIDIFPIVIDIVVKYENYAKGYEIRNKIRQLLGKFNWQLSADWEWTIAFRQFLSPVYDKESNEIIFGSIYLLKQNYDYADNSD
jgi:hypothetical protein